MEYMTKKEQFKDGMKVLFDYDGETHEGVVSRDNEGDITILNNKAGDSGEDYLKGVDMRGFDCSFCLWGTTEEFYIYSFENIRPAKSTTSTRTLPVETRNGVEFTKDTIDSITLEEYDSIIETKKKERDELNAELRRMYANKRTHSRLLAKKSMRSVLD